MSLQSLYLRFRYRVSNPQGLPTNMLRNFCAGFPNVSLGESLYSIDYADKSSSPSPLTKQILNDILHDDVIVEGVGGDVVGSKYNLGSIFTIYQYSSPKANNGTISGE